MTIAFNSVFGSAGSGPGQFYAPSTYNGSPELISFDTNWIYVGDIGAATQGYWDGPTFHPPIKVTPDRIHYFNKERNYQTTLVLSNNPVGGNIPINNRGGTNYFFLNAFTVDDTHIYAVGADCLIVRFNKGTLTYVDEIVFATLVDFIGGIKVDSTRLYIHDRFNDTLNVYDKSTYELIKVFDWDTDAVGVIDFDIDSNYIYIADYYNYQVVKYNKSTFAVVGSFGTYGTGDSQFDDGFGYLAVDDVAIYVVDVYPPYHAHTVQAFDKTTFASTGVIPTTVAGTGNGEFGDLYGVRGIAVDNHVLWATDPSNSRIQTFTYTPPVVDSGGGGSSSGGLVLREDYFETEGIGPL